MLTFIKSIPKPLLIVTAVIFILILVASYQGGYINGEKSRS